MARIVSRLSERNWFHTIFREEETVIDMTRYDISLSKYDSLLLNEMSYPNIIFIKEGVAIKLISMIDIVT